jgi:hypothetical protein
MTGWTQGEDYGRRKMLLNLDDVLRELKVKERKAILERVERER